MRRQRFFENAGRRKSSPGSSCKIHEVSAGSTDDGKPVLYKVFLPVTFPYIRSSHKQDDTNRI